MKQNKLQAFGISFLCLCFVSVCLFTWLKKDTEYSQSERRKLNTPPEITAPNILSGKFMSQFEKYSTDQFAFRDSLRTLKSLNHYYLYRMKDNNGIYIKDGYAAKIEYPLNKDSIKNATDKFNYIYNTYLKNNCKDIYLSVIPDKGYFLAEDGGYLSMDYEKFFNAVKKNTQFAKYIDITPLLKKSSYYKTDTHWKQENIQEVAGEIAEKMNFKRLLSFNYSKRKAAVPFYGVYYGQSALPLKSDELYYLTNPSIQNSVTYNIETKKYGKVYDMEKLHGKDPYEMFLSGASAIITIKNENAASDRKLVIFRDSFGSSLSPLFIEAYSEITLIDIRYINSNLLEEYIDFENKEVLFLYSTLILNSSNVFK